MKCHVVSNGRLKRGSARVAVGEAAAIGALRDLANKGAIWILPL